MLLKVRDQSEWPQAGPMQRLPPAALLGCLNCAFPLGFLSSCTALPIHLHPELCPPPAIPVPGSLHAALLRDLSPELNNLPLSMPGASQTAPHKLYCGLHDMYKAGLG